MLHYYTILYNTTILYYRILYCAARSRTAPERTSSVFARTAFAAARLPSKTSESTEIVRTVRLSLRAKYFS